MKRLLTLLGLGVACLGARAQTDPAYPTSPAASSITQAEMFLDNDPGVGSATPVAVTAGADVTLTATASTASLAPGIHRIILRSRSAAGDWSLTARTEFLVDYSPAYTTTTASVSPVVRAEYFIDADPGQGLGTPVTVSQSSDISNLTFAVNTGSLATGFHRVFLRTQSSTGQWSVPEMREFSVTQDYPYTTPTAPGSTVVRAEYFVDTDPGYGLATAIPLTAGVNVSGVTASVNTAGLALGLHRVGVRTQDANGRWTATSVSELLVTDDFAYPPAPAAAAPLVQAEYFIDTDPGFGQATPVSFTSGTEAANVSVTVNTAGLAPGSHILYIRSRQNPWSVTMAQPFSISVPLALEGMTFSAEKTGAAAKLSWEVSDEKNVRHFAVERSAEGAAWTEIGRVTPDGSKTYTLTDDLPETGKNLYRVKTLDASGIAAFSAIRTLEFGSAVATISLRPNPTRDVFYTDGAESGSWVEVWNSAGSLVAHYIATPGGSHDVSRLPGGIYLVRIIARNGEVQTARLVKQ